LLIVLYNKMSFSTCHRSVILNIFTYLIKEPNKRSNIYDCYDPNRLINTFIVKDANKCKLCKISAWSQLKNKDAINIAKLLYKNSETICQWNQLTNNDAIELAKLLYKNSETICPVFQLKTNDAINIAKFLCKNYRTCNICDITRHFIENKYHMNMNIVQTNWITGMHPFVLYFQLLINNILASPNISKWYNIKSNAIFNCFNIITNNLLKSYDMNGQSTITSVFNSNVYRTDKSNTLFAYYVKKMRINKLNAYINEKRTRILAIYYYKRYDELVKDVEKLLEVHKIYNNIKYLELKI
jgi:hypothetical protein